VLVFRPQMIIPLAGPGKAASDKKNLTASPEQVYKHTDIVDHL